MDIKDKLKKSIDNANAERDSLHERLAENTIKAEQQFQPVYDALQELIKEVGSVEDIKIFLHKNSARIRLGLSTTIECDWFIHDAKYSILVKNIWESGISERTHKFEDSDKTIEFIIDACAKYIASRKPKN